MVTDSPGLISARTVKVPPASRVSLCNRALVANSDAHSTASSAAGHPWSRGWSISRTRRTSSGLPGKVAETRRPEAGWTSVPITGSTLVTEPSVRPVGGAQQGGPSHHLRRAAPIQLPPGAAGPIPSLTAPAVALRCWAPAHLARFGYFAFSANSRANGFRIAAKPGCLPSAASGCSFC